MGDASLSNVEEQIVVKHALVDASDRHKSNMIQSSIQCNESFIPTAIVKPKYQKLSFDERQLPICGSAADENWSPTNNLSTTITTTPRKIQKHLPKSSQKSFSKQNRKLNKNAEFCVGYEVSDKESIGSLRHSEKGHDSCVNQNSIAIVQPLKKAIDASVNSGDEQNQKLIDSSKNSFVMSHKHEQKTRNSNKIIATNVFPSRMSECGSKNVNNTTRKAENDERVGEKNVLSSNKKSEKENSGEKVLMFLVGKKLNGC